MNGKGRKGNRPSEFREFCHEVEAGRTAFFRDWRVDEQVLPHAHVREHHLRGHELSIKYGKVDQLEAAYHRSPGVQPLARSDLMPRVKRFLKPPKYRCQIPPYGTKNIEEESTSRIPIILRAATNDSTRALSSSTNTLAQYASSSGGPGSGGHRTNTGVTPPTLPASRCEMTRDRMKHWWATAQRRDRNAPRRSFP